MHKSLSNARSITVLATGLTMAHIMGGCAARHRTFGDDVEFLREHTGSTLVLGHDPSGPRVAVVGEYQGRVMTSSATGDEGRSYGWINYDLIASGELRPHMNAFGGEERLWLGPEGGQFALFFAPGTEFAFEDWQTPAPIDSEPFELVGSGPTSASYSRNASIENYSGAAFDLRIDRDVVLLDERQIGEALGAPIAGLSAVGYETRNRVTNTGPAAWTKERGLVSIWLLGMFKPGQRTTVVIPFREGDEARLGRVVNDEYFGKVPAERLKVGDGVLFFRGDSQHRGKIGLSPRRATPLAGSWDPDMGVLTIVQFSFPGPEVADYVNSMWRVQEDPYGGDVINSYNDGPTTPGGKALGGFYEIETSSPALALKPGQSGVHTSRTIHLEGDRAALDAVARRTLGVGLGEIEAAFAE
ncbi:MAG TPA: DUF6786 family protein [Phycisphaerales bacterium]|nr:DUF6786 family protein [Phycisphaerales bacterium]